jgi:hypothetical protein
MVPQRIVASIIVEKWLIWTQVTNYVWVGMDIICCSVNSVRWFYLRCNHKYYTNSVITIFKRMHIIKEKQNQCLLLVSQWCNAYNARTTTLTMLIPYKNFMIGFIIWHLKFANKSIILIKIMLWDVRFFFLMSCILALQCL